MSDFDASVVGAGPNGLAAAVELARAGRKVLVVERAGEIGGGTRTEELTLPGFRHDACSAIHPSGIASPFFNEVGLEVEWVQPPIPFTHPLGEGRAAALFRSVEETAAQFGDDAATYSGLMASLVENIDELADNVLSPVTIIPKHKSSFARLAALGGMSASMLANRFRSKEARALIAGLSAHSISPFGSLASASVALALGAIGHVYGWPVAKGGSQAIADALAEQLKAMGGSIETSRDVVSVDELPAGVILLDVMPPAAMAMARDRISAMAARRISSWKPGPGVFKVDWALDGPIPWSDPLSSQAGTVHIGGTYEEIEAAEREVFAGRHPERPFVLLAQQSLFDPTRAPEGKHTAWAYCHVPNGSAVDMTAAIESQIERLAPGFRDLILARHTRSAVEYQDYNPNYVGGDIGGGAFGLKKILQLGAKRPYILGDGIFLCSSATPPGAGVHGMCGYHAARAALADRTK
ncbi:MAG: phytoene desaturase family protein [Acidimicrobiia bacterium]